MAKPRCAACGSDLRKGQKLGFVDCYIVHHHCIHTPANVWAVVQERVQATASSAAQVRVLEAEVAELTASIVKHRRLLEQAEWSAVEHEKDHQTTVARLRAQVRNADQRELDLMTRGQQLVAEVTQLRAQVERAIADGGVHADGRVKRFMATTIGVSISRGVWGIATYFAWRLDTLDPTVARFALLDLS